MQCPKCGCTKLSKHGKAGSGKQRYDCTACGHRTTSPSTRNVTQFKSTIEKKPIYLITSAQNATPAFKPFLSALEVYEEYNDAELVVIPYRYTNPTSLWSETSKDSDWWASEVVKYLHDGRFDLNDNITILGDIKVQPTATSPLTGLETITGGMSGVVGHPKLELKCVATPQHKLPKLMTTTGSVTVKNYTDTKAGKKGDFHHTFGAAVIEIDGDTFHLRQISADKDGSFIDLDKHYSKDGVKKAPPALGLVMGDTHADFVCQDVVSATFGKGGIVDTLIPKHLVWHDLLDFYSANHHHRDNPFIAIAKHKDNRGCVRSEIDRAIKFVRYHNRKNATNVFVNSNHPGALARWIKETDWRGNPENAEFYLETALEMVRSSRMGNGGAEYSDPFHYWVKKSGLNAVLLGQDQSYMLGDIEVGIHGHNGPNGSRGNIKAFSRIGVKSMIGHSHTPGICEGCYQVGTSTRLRLEYNHGPSSWLNTHGVIYANGKRSLISVINGSWRLK